MWQVGCSRNRDSIPGGDEIFVSTLKMVDWLWNRPASYLAGKGDVLFHVKLVSA
jgi:hypothetical protein